MKRDETYADLQPTIDICELHLKNFAPVVADVAMERWRDEESEQNL
jgi:hypothetical protein